MISTRQADGIRSYFVAFTKNGLIAPGIDPDDITVTVIAPDLTTSSVVDASETAAKPGVYTLLVPSSFLVDNGLGYYGLIVEVDSSSPKVAGVMQDLVKVSQKDIDECGGGGGNGDGGFDDEASKKLCEVWTLLGLDPDAPLCITKTRQEAGDIVLVQTEVGLKIVVQRQEP